MSVCLLFVMDILVCFYFKSLLLSFLFCYVLPFVYLFCNILGIITAYLCYYLLSECFLQNFNDPTVCVLVKDALVKGVCAQYNMTWQDKN
jgi:hypothetical protein